MRCSTLVIFTAAVLSAKLCTGCMGPAHASVVHAPLRVDGHVQNAQKQPLANTTIKIAIAPFTRDYELKRKTIDGTLTSYQAYNDYIITADAKTDASGRFTVSLPKRNYYHPAAFIGFIVIGGGTKYDVNMTLTHDANDSPIYFARLHKRRFTLNRLNESTLDFEELSKVGESNEISGKAKRSKKEDVVTLTLTVP